jgi:hypothetical protein
MNSGRKWFTKSTPGKDDAGLEADDRRRAGGAVHGAGVGRGGAGVAVERGAGSRQSAGANLFISPFRPKCFLAFFTELWTRTSNKNDIQNLFQNYGKFS